jgi:hypothetical protein
MSYSPRPSDTAWARAMVAQMSDGAAWMTPATGDVYRINHGARVLRLVVPGPLPADTAWLFERNRAVWATVGYSVAKADDGGAQ